jgi:hypothetical protein
MGTKIVWKDEDEVNGRAVGPAWVAEVDSSERGIRTIEIVERLRWMTKPEAKREARDRGIEFEEV